MKRPRGFSLIELLVALSVLLVTSALAFFIFELGSRWFRTLITQQGLESQLRRFSATVRRDLELTHYQGVTSVTARSLSVLGQSRARHALCLPGVSNWSAASAYDPASGLPNWDRYLLYYANLDESGRVIRCLIDPPGGVFAAGPLTGFQNNPGGYLLDDPHLIPEHESHREVARDVLEFSVQLDGSQTIVLDLKLRLEQELRELRLEVIARNTFPLL